MLWINNHCCSARIVRIDNFFIIKIVGISLELSLELSAINLACEAHKRDRVENLHFQPRKLPSPVINIGVLCTPNSEHLKSCLTRSTFPLFPKK